MKTLRKRSQKKNARACVAYLQWRERTSERSCERSEVTLARALIGNARTSVPCYTHTCNKLNLVKVLSKDTVENGSLGVLLLVRVTLSHVATRSEVIGGYLALGVLRLLMLPSQDRERGHGMFVFHWCTPPR